MSPARELDVKALIGRGFGDAPFVHENGIRLADIGPGWCEAEMDITPHHLQHLGVVHGGVLMTIADHCAGAAAETVRAGRQVTFVEASVWSIGDAGASLCARASVTLTAARGAQASEAR